MRNLEELKRAVESLTFEERVELDAYLWSTMPNVRYSAVSVDERMKEIEAEGASSTMDLHEPSVVREEPK